MGNPLRLPSLRNRLRLAARALRRGEGRQPTTELLPPASDNVAYNRALWDRYAKRWDDPSFRARNADALDDVGAFEVVGDEWGRRKDVDDIIADYILPFVNDASMVAELGCGGGRVARRVSPHVATLYCCDISGEMLERARAAIDDPGVRFLLVQDGLPHELAGRLDFVYAFDVFLHLDLYVMWRSLQDMARVLKPGGHAFVHTTNLTSEEGWRNFVKFDRYRPETHFYVSPEIVRTLVTRAGFRIVKESSPDPSNFYLARDFLALFRKS